MTKHTRKISNEKIITALLQHGTVTEAAEAAGTTPSTIYDRMKGRKFREDYMDAKNDVICKAVYSITAKVSEAIDTTQWLTL